MLYENVIRKVLPELPDDFFKRIVESVNYEIFVCDKNGKIIYLNPASEYLTGRLYSNIVGKHITEIVDDGTLSDNVTLHVLETKKPQKIIAKVNNGNDLLTIGLPIFEEEDPEEIKYVVVTGLDMSELSMINNNILQENFNLQHELDVLSRLKKDYLSLEDSMFVGEIYEGIINELFKVAPLDIIILIQGETGTGKTGIAKLIHQLSTRSNGPFIKINCGMIPENLFESELFGYEEGAFTGALKGGKAGKIELANNGTLFLDEIGELPLSMQVKLLDFIQEKTITRVGGHKKIAVNTRIVAATHRDLKTMSEEGAFRQDLYYRLEVFPITVPPLRNWGDDILHLSQFFLYKLNKKYGKMKTFHKDIMIPLKQHDWPGNIRELEHVIERIYVYTDVNEISAADFVRILSRDKSADNAIICSDIVPLKKAKAEIEKQLLRKAYSQCRSSYEVAKALEIDQSTVIKLKKKHGM